MIVINNIDSQRFSFNGVEYFKNFTPIVIGDKIRILNTYDSSIELTDAPRLYSEFSVNDLVFDNVASLQSYLLPIVFSRLSLNGDFLSNNISTYEEATLPIADTDQLFVIQDGEVKKVDKSEIGGGGTNLDTILNNLGVFVKFNQASASHYPFVGVAVNSGTIQGVAINDNLITKYSNAFVRIQASTSANTGYRMTDGNTYPTALLEGVTYFSIMCPLSVTNTAIVYGMPATNTLTTTSEVLSSGAWFSITGNQLQAKCAYSSVMSAGSSVTINVNEWLLSTIEVIENNASTKKIRFKVRKIDGTLIYNEDITSNIQPYNVYNGMSTGFRAIRTTTGSTENIFGLQAIGFWAEKPNFLKDF